MTDVANRPGRRTWSQWTCAVAVKVADPRRVDEAAAMVSALMNDVDRAVSRFRDDSELVSCNRRAGRVTLVSPLTAELVAASLDAAAATDGLVDPTVGRHLENAGYDRDIEAIHDDVRDIVSVGPRPTRKPNWRAVTLDRSLDMVLVPRGLALDLGATAKAWTADQAASMLSTRWPGHVMVEIGGDVAVANASHDPFVIRVSEREGMPGELVSLTHGGLATSTTVVRRWGTGRRTSHHIIDPRTGRPSQGRWRTVSVWAPSTLAANTASTAAVVAGDQAVSWLQERRHPARLIDLDGKATYTCDWPTAEAAAS
ncbi:MAG: FAD:protein FMN transferase [Sporichthyaceae bacterium]